MIRKKGPLALLAFLIGRVFGRLAKDAYERSLRSRVKEIDHLQLFLAMRKKKDTEK